MIRQLIIAMFLVIGNQLLIQTKADSQDVFTLKGKITDSAIEKLVLRYVDDAGSIVMDTATVDKGKFQFKGKIAGPTIASIRGNLRSNSVDDPRFRELWLEPAILSINFIDFEFKKAKSFGSKTQVEQDNLDLILKPISKKTDSIYQLLLEAANSITSEKDSLRNSELVFKKKQLEADLEEQRNIQRKVELNYVSKNPNSFISPELLFYLFEYLPVDSALFLYSGFSAPVQASKSGQKVFTLISKKQNSSVGHKAPEFAIIDLHNNSIKLSDMRGRCVLLEFWASWCVPCRAGFPMLKRLHEKYAANGLEIVAISRDLQKKDWEKAIFIDSISNWIHCSVFESYIPGANGLYKLNEIENKYYIPGIPLTIVINREGIIIGYFFGRTHDNERALELLLDKELGNRSS